jgi:exosome complex RNA-binding protein Rrp4
VYRKATKTRTMKETGRMIIQTRSQNLRRIVEGMLLCIHHLVVFSFLCQYFSIANCLDQTHRDISFLTDRHRIFVYPDFEGTMMMLMTKTRCYNGLGISGM